MMLELELKSGGSITMRAVHLIEHGAACGRKEKGRREERWVGDRWGRTNMGMNVRTLCLCPLHHKSTRQLLPVCG
jgi:hypothetical protein